MAELLEIAVEIAVPGLAPAMRLLGTVRVLCAELRDGKDTCVHFYDRLRRILEGIDALYREHGRVPHKDVAQFEATLNEYWRHLEAYKEMNVVQRVLNRRKLRETIAHINDNLDDLYRSLQLAGMGEIMEWRSEYEKDIQRRDEKLDTLLKDRSEIVSALGGIQEKLDAIVLLKAERDRIQSGHSDLSEDSQRAVQAALQNVISDTDNHGTPTPPWFILESDVSFDATPFGSGSLGSVHRGTLRDKAPVVVRMLLPGQNGMNASLQKIFCREIELWRSFDSPHVVRLFGGCHVASRPFFVCEYAANGNLVQFLARDPANERLRWKLLYEAAVGLKHLHSKSVVHGNLKCSNILVSDKLTALVSDFGMSRVKERSRYQAMTRRLDGSIVLGPWMAPECSSSLPQLESDIYSLAMCIIEAFTRKNPYSHIGDSEAIDAEIKSGKLPPQPITMPDDAWALVEEMTTLEREKRKNLDEVIVKLHEFADEGIQAAGGAVVSTIVSPMSVGHLHAQKGPRSKAGDHVDGAVSEAIVCNSCGTSNHPTNARFCHSCGGMLLDTSSLLHELQRTTKLASRSHIFQRWYRQLKTDSALFSSSDMESVIRLLRMSVEDPQDMVDSLYAFGCLLLLYRSAAQDFVGDIDQLKRDLSSRIGSADVIWSNLFVKSHGQRAAELVELVLQVDARFKSRLSKYIPDLARVFATSSALARNAALSALVAIAHDDSMNCSAIANQSIHKHLLQSIKTGSSIEKTNASLLLNLVSATDVVIVDKAFILELVGQLEAASSPRRDHLAVAIVNLAWTTSDTGLLHDLHELVVHNKSLRNILATNPTVLQYCCDHLQNQEEPEASRLLSELVKESEFAVRTVRKCGAINMLAQLAKSNDMYAIDALVNSIETLLQEPSQDEPEPEP